MEASLNLDPRPASRFNAAVVRSGIVFNVVSLLADVLVIRETIFRNSYNL
jgi:hypothetical protein